MARKTVTNLTGYEINFTGVFGDFAYHMSVPGHPVIARVYTIYDAETGQEISTYYAKLVKYYVSKEKLMSILHTGQYFNKNVTFDKDELKQWLGEN